MTRLSVLKTYKLFINGAFPRTESGRSMVVGGIDGEVVAHLCLGSRKDFREAVEAAAKAQPKWAGLTAYNRGQILYRMAEMMEGKAGELSDAIRATRKATAADAKREVAASIDRLVAFAGWTDKFSQVLGCHNPVAGPYYNFTVPEATGVAAIVAPEEPALLGLVTLVAPALCAGCAVVALASERHPIPAAVLGEICATSDVPPGALNILTGTREELLGQIAEHRGLDAIGAANLSAAETALLRGGAAGNVKRVHVQTIRRDGWHDAPTCESPWTIEPFVEMKTIWHPAGT